VPDRPDHVRPHDLATAAALAAGDEAAFADLVRELSPSLVRLARGYVGSHAVAEEIVQDVWVSVFRGITGYEGRASLRTWVHRICARAALRRATSERRSIPFADAFDDGPTVDASRFASVDARDNPRGWSSAPRPWRAQPEDHVLRAEQRAAVSVAVESLPDRQRLVLVMRDVDGFSADEVCEALNLTEGHQRVLLHRARAHVRTRLEEEVGAS
jgi:RNA polymerase sigma-70 factor, ECF subfamily